jgi:pyrimidine-nucleoside phosphorylase
VAEQGGDTSVIDNYEIMPKAEHKIEILSNESGYISQLDAMAVAVTTGLLGASRNKKDEPIDLGVGVELKAKRGQKVEKGEILAVLYANNLKYIEQALAKIQSAFIFSDKAPAATPLIREIIS